MKSFKTIIENEDKMEEFHNISIDLAEQLSEVIDNLPENVQQTAFKFFDLIEQLFDKEVNESTVAGDVGIYKTPLSIRMQNRFDYRKKKIKNIQSRLKTNKKFQSFMKLKKEK